MPDPGNTRSAELGQWSSAGTVELFDNMFTRRHRRQLRLLAIMLVVPFSVLLYLLYGMVQDSARLTLISEYDHAVQRLEQLNRTNPAIKAAAEKSRQLRTAAVSKAAYAGAADLREALRLISHAEALDRDLRRLRELVNPMGTTLTQTEWYDSSARIKTHREQLQKQHTSISQLLDQGEIAAAEKQLAELLTAVGDLHRDNVAAMQTDVTRSDWLRLSSRVPPRLRQDPALLAINERAAQGEGGWAAGDWKNAGQCYSGAINDLQKWFDGMLTAEEKAVAQQADAGEIKRLETEKAALDQQVRNLDAELRGLEKQVVTANAERTAALEQTTRLQAERDAAVQQAKIGEQLPKVRQELEEKTAALKAAENSLAALTKTQQELQQSKTQLEQQLAASVAEVTALKQSIPAGSPATPEAQVAIAIARIRAVAAQANQRMNLDARIQAAEQQLADGFIEYGKAVALRQQALNEKFLPTSQKVQGIDRTIVDAEKLLTDLLRVLDGPLAEKYNMLQAGIDGAEQAYAALMKEVTPENTEALKLKAEIDRLRRDQAAVADAWRRHKGKLTLQGEQLVAACRTLAAAAIKSRPRGDLLQLLSIGRGPQIPDTQWAAVQPGKFKMGSEKGGSDEQPVREREISYPFLISKHETTIALILLWLNSPGVQIQPGWIDLEDSDCPIRKNGSRYELNTASRFGKSDQQPMVCISRPGAEAFCKWLNTQDPRFTFRLPWEVEWEYAARAGSTTEFPWGDSCNGKEANIDGNGPFGTSTKGPDLQATTKVGSYPPNAWGLYDTVGNCAEWCLDGYEANFYPRSALRDPRNPAAPGGRVVFRSGSWNSGGTFTRSAYRNSLTPGSMVDSIGFRVVAD